MNKFFWNQKIRGKIVVGEESIMSLTDIFLLEFMVFMIGFIIGFTVMIMR